MNDYVYNMYNFITVKDIKFSYNSISYFKDLIKNEKKGTNIRIHVEYGGTPDANVLINYCD